MVGKFSLWCASLLWCQACSIDLLQESLSSSTLSEYSKMQPACETLQHIKVHHRILKEERVGMFCEKRETTYLESLQFRHSWPCGGKKSGTSGLGPTCLQHTVVRPWPAQVMKVSTAGDRILPMTAVLRVWPRRQPKAASDLTICTVC